MSDRCGMTEGRSRLRLVRRSALAAVVAGAVLAVTAAPASAAGNVPATAPLDLWGVDGTANAVVVSGSTVYVGGSFTSARRYIAVGPEGERHGPDPGHAQAGRQPQRRSDNGPARSTARCGRSPSMPAGSISAVTSRPSTTSCDPTSPGSTARPAQLDAGWNVTADKTVRDMVLVGTTLYLVGDFTKVNGTARKRAAAVSTGRRQPGPQLPPEPDEQGVRGRRRRREDLLRRQLHLGHGTARSFLAAVNASDGQLTGLRPTTGSTALCSTSPSRVASSSPPPTRASTRPRRGAWTGGRCCGGTVRTVTCRPSSTCGATPTSGSTTATTSTARAPRTTPSGSSPPTPAPARRHTLRPQVERQRRRPRAVLGRSVPGRGREVPEDGRRRREERRRVRLLAAELQPRARRSPAGGQPARPTGSGAAASRPCDDPAPDPRRGLRRARRPSLPSALSGTVRCWLSYKLRPLLPPQ